MKKALNQTKPGHQPFVIALLFFVVASCSKKETSPPPPPPPNFSVSAWKINGQSSQTSYLDVPVKPVINFSFSTPISRSSAASAITLNDAGNNPVKLTMTFGNSDNEVSLTPEIPLQHLTKYTLNISSSLKSAAGGNVLSSLSVQFMTSLDSSRKFPLISDDSLLTLVQKQTFKYFWDFGHPVSGLARERNTSGDVVTSGGSGFGIMTIVTAVHRGFITRADGLNRMKTIVAFLKDKAKTFHGAFPHWLNGSSGDVVPFSNLDDGADLVETSYLIQGLLTARQYFNGADAMETTLRDDINTIWKGVDWDWFRKGENTLYWHWSPSSQWAINMPIRGWNEALITYVLAASSPTSTITKAVYDNGWAANGAIRNGNSFQGIQLPLGPDYGGPLFFAHYSFLGINPNGLADAYAASYFEQNKAHTQINNKYSIANPKGFYGYSDSTWGLTASDIPNGYTASSPTNDIGVIAPTAALSSFPYTPTESMKALKFFYYVLGDKIWKEYGFVDAFSLKDAWFANSFLAIDQGPIIVMIENHRSGLLWNLFMSSPEVKAGLRKIGFTSPFI
jgi:hypothetical protein